MRLKTRKVFELYNIDGQKLVTFSRKEAKEAFQKGFDVLECDIVENRISRKQKVVTIYVKSW
jgi:hypothetical protein